MSFSTSSSARKPLRSNGWCPPAAHGSRRRADREGCVVLRTYGLVVTDINAGRPEDGDCGTPLQTCPCCRRARPLSAFAGANGRRTKYCATCREVRRESNRAHRERIGSAGTRAAHLWHKYHITPEDYDALREMQDHRCAICGTHEEDVITAPRGRSRLDGKPRAAACPLVVDHCHATGAVRGLLCAGCNSALGHFGDRIESLDAAIRYLRTAAAAAPRTVPQTCRLRVIDPRPDGRPPRTVRFRGAVTVQIDGHAVEIAEGETKTVVSTSGAFTVSSHAP
jgi:hypothetical protein